MGKSTISMAMFNSYVTVYQRVITSTDFSAWPKKSIFRSFGTGRRSRLARSWCRIGRATRREPESACLLRRMWCHGLISMGILVLGPWSFHQHLMDWWERTRKDGTFKRRIMRKIASMCSVYVNVWYIFAYMIGWFLELYWATKNPVLGILGFRREESLFSNLLICWPREIE